MSEQELDEIISNRIVTSNTYSKYNFFIDSNFMKMLVLHTADNEVRHIHKVLKHKSKFYFKAQVLLYTRPFWSYSEGAFELLKFESDPLMTHKYILSFYE